MRMSPAGRAFLQGQEGARLTAYQDSAGIWTIGVGHTAAAGLPAPKRGMTITAGEADAILTADLELFETAVAEAVKVRLEQHEFDALVSLVFNIGTGAFERSTLLSRLNTGDRNAAGAAFASWIYAGGQKSAGLKARREREAVLFLQGYYTDVPESVPRVADSAQETDAPAITPDRRTIARLNLRASPVNGPVLLVLPEDHPIEAVDGWLKVNAIVDGELVTGWVSTRYTRETED